MSYYTGIGSRETPDEVMELMYHTAQHLAKLNMTLRSGGADGADTAFEQGCKSVGGKCDIYIPWDGFNDRSTGIVPPLEKVSELVMRLHAAPHKLRPGAFKLHSRNMFQILGDNLDTPSQFVLVYTKNRTPVGGTATALALAVENGIPIFNFDSFATINEQQHCLNMFLQEHSIEPVIF